MKYKHFDNYSFIVKLIKMKLIQLIYCIIFLNIMISLVEFTNCKDFGIHGSGTVERSRVYGQFSAKIPIYESPKTNIDLTLSRSGRLDSLKGGSKEIKLEIKKSF